MRDSGQCSREEQMGPEYRDDRNALRMRVDSAGSGVNVGRGERAASVVAGALLAVYGLRRRGAGGWLAALGGASLVKRGLTGHCEAYSWMGVSSVGNRLHAEDASVDPDSSIDVHRSVRVQRSPTACYEVWRDFSRLPAVMDYLVRVDVLDDTRSRWYAKGPAGITVEWDAEIVRDVQDERIAWQSVEPADVPNRGVVEFREVGDGSVTEVRVHLEWDPPLGRVAKAVAAAFRRDPALELENALERFRQVMESPHPAGGPAR
jgi:uncharacterized membrane protein